MGVVLDTDHGGGEEIPSRISIASRYYGVLKITFQVKSAYFV